MSKCRGTAWTSRSPRTRSTTATKPIRASTTTRKGAKPYSARLHCRWRRRPGSLNTESGLDAIQDPIFRGSPIAAHRSTPSTSSRSTTLSGKLTVARPLCTFLRRCGVIDVLREGPLVPFKVGDLVAPVAGMYLQLGDDHRPQCLRVLVVTLDVVNVHVEHAADPAARTVAVNRGPADRDQTVQHLHLGAARLAIGVRVMRNHALLKSEYLGQ